MDFKDIVEILPLKFKNRIKKLEILKGGSDRIFLKAKENDFVIIVSNPTSGDFISYLKIQRFLKNKNLGVPEIYYVDKKRGILIVEDLGDISLEKNPSQKNYMKVIDFLIKMQVRGLRGFLNLKLPYKKVFDKNKLLYETDYFKNFYINKYRRLDCGKNLFKKAFNFLANNISKLPYFFMHRDFQSKNIFIKKGKIRITDFQTAHKGPFTYDVASLLFDPYVNLKKSMIEKLSGYYYKKMKGRIRMGFKDFDFYLSLTGIQRLSQALAAFVNLSEFKGKREFKRYIPVAEKKLKELVDRVAIYELKPLKELFS